jgi:hypothetical protein
MGLWSSGYDVSLTRRRSPVRFWSGPVFFYSSHNERIGFDSDYGHDSAQNHALTFGHFEDFSEYVKLNGYTQNYVTHLLTYYRKYFSGKRYSSPLHILHAN